MNAVLICVYAVGVVADFVAWLIFCAKEYGAISVGDVVFCVFAGLLWPPIGLFLILVYSFRQFRALCGIRLWENPTAKTVDGAEAVGENCDEEDL